MRTPALISCVLALVFACKPADDEGDEAGTETASETATETAETTGGECMPPGEFGNCIDGGAAACMAEGATLCPTDNLDNPSLGVCAKRCDDVCECWAAPATGDAAVACVPLVDGDPKKTCVLDCSAGQTCPDGMQCLDTLSICVWPSAG
ncbi:hypothetical protein ACNOYE_22070 [Nannocystaceae bacterium ST9]